MHILIYIQIDLAFEILILHTDTNNKCSLNTIIHTATNDNCSGCTTTKDNCTQFILSDDFSIGFLWKFNWKFCVYEG